MKWQEKLTKKELKHLGQEALSHTLADFRKVRAAQTNLRGKDGREPCFECRHIALKLGLET